jgi:hypothetical protein
MTTYIRFAETGSLCVPTYAIVRRCKVIKFERLARCIIYRPTQFGNPT